MVPRRARFASEIAAFTANGAYRRYLIDPMESTDRQVIVALWLVIWIACVCPHQFAGAARMSWATDCHRLEVPTCLFGQSNKDTEAYEFVRLYHEL